MSSPYKINTQSRQQSKHIYLYIMNKWNKEKDIFTSYFIYVNVCGDVRVGMTVLYESFGLSTFSKISELMWSLLLSLPNSKVSIFKSA